MNPGARAAALALLVWTGAAGAQVTHYLDDAHQDAQHQPVCYVGVVKPRALATIRLLTLTVRCTARRWPTRS